MAKGNLRQGAQDGPQISPEERARIAKAAKQLASYANFLRWTANFRKDEITQHARHERVMMISPMQSGRFSFCVKGDTILLGVQPFEAIWMASMPLDKAYVSDRLYLAVEGVACMDSKLPPLGIGFFVDDQVKRKQMAAAKWLQPMQVRVQGGSVVVVERKIGAKIPVSNADIIASLSAVAQAKLKQQDMSRFF